MKQTMIAISREFGSGGDEMAERIAKDFQLPLYDKNILEKLEEESGFLVKDWEKYDERPKFKLTSRNEKGFSTSMEDNLAEKQFDFIRQKAEQKESFLVLGRCAESVLYGRPELISLFICDSMENRIKRISEEYNISEKEALMKIKKHDASRKMYHRQHSDFRWGDSRYYDLCVNSGKLGLEKTTEYLEKYIVERCRQM